MAVDYVKAFLKLRTSKRPVAFIRSRSRCPRLAGNLKERSPREDDKFHRHLDSSAERRHQSSSGMGTGISGQTHSPGRTQSAGWRQRCIARLFAQKLSEAWGQQVVVENRGGAGTTIQTLDSLSRMQPPDGYTLILSLVSSLR